MKLHGNLNIKENDLYISNLKIIDIAKEFSTPCYIMDENLIRDNIKKFKYGIGKDNVVVYAGKTFLNSHMINILKDENISLDVVSDGELYIAYKNGFEMENIIFHGNNKSYIELKMGVELGVGRFVCDSEEEIDMLYKICKEENKEISVFIRINPGIDAHTHEYIKTACVDSKFGIYKELSTLESILNKYKNNKYLHIIGFHCHIGSQIFGKEAFLHEVDELLKIIKSINDKGFNITELNLGGGFGIYYIDGDTPLSIEEYTNSIIDRVKIKSQEYLLNKLKLYIEPGRSIVGNAGTTIYEIGAIKEIEGIRNYVSVDGGMTDNIRTALYDADYECLIVNKAKDIKNYKATISGKCCESGDIIVKDTFIAKPKRGDILAVFSTGAYCYSMSSNYNKLRKLPVIFIYNGVCKLTTKRESLDDLMRLDN